MRHLLYTLLLLPSLATGNELAKQAQLEQQALQKIPAFSKQLKQTLKSAVKQGGLGAGIHVCSQVANDIAQQHSTQGWTIARTSLKYRNPENQPSAWLVKQLNTLERMKQQGVSNDKLFISELINHDSGKEFRLVKAIPTDKLCLNCHGSNVAKPVQKALSSLYPNDLATGYRFDDIRGAFVVTKQLP